MLSRLVRFVAVCVLACLPTHALFGQIFGVPQIGMHAGEWALTPIMERQANSAWLTKAVLALRTTEAQGDNIVSIVYERDPANPCQWIAKAWSTSDPWDAIKTVKMQYAIGDEYDSRWQVGQGPKDTSAPKPTYAYVKGFYESDPVGIAINNLPDRDDYVTAFVEWGYCSAKVPFEVRDAVTGEWKIDAALNGYAQVFDAVVADDPTPPDTTHPQPSIPSNPPPSWFPPGTTIPSAPSAFCQYWFNSGCFTVNFGWGSWTSGAWVSDGENQLTQRCFYKRLNCRTRMLVKFCVLPDGTIGVESTSTEQECWTQKVYAQMPATGCEFPPPDYVDDMNPPNQPPPTGPL
jgi:hypothetical protein